MCAGRETPQVGKIQVLRDQESLFLLAGIPKRQVRTSAKVFLEDRLRVVAQGSKP
jgi:hypothetical protein